MKLDRHTAHMLTAEEAWAWLQKNRGAGLQAGRVEAYAVSPDVVEITVNDSIVDVGRSIFIATYRHAIFRPIWSRSAL